MKGECHTCNDDTVWITKIHPIKVLAEIPSSVFSGTKQLYLIRNPIDMFVSEFLLFTAMSHSHKVNEDLREHPAFKKSIQIAVERVNVMQRNVQRQAEHVPTLYLTYEMLMLEPYQTLTDIFRFFFDTPSLEGTVVEQRIKDVCAEGHASKAIYSLKTTNQKDNLSRNRHSYTDSDIALIKHELRDILHFYGYTTHPTENNLTAFFEFDDQTEEDLKRFRQFRKLNEETLAKVGQVD